ncbi:MAG TPA: DUF3311 domain-containing protein [Pilimelia sp.]|nr:DUF3311 domain-containing protein [Pilimelia sp.]
MAGEEHAFPDEPASAATRHDDDRHPWHWLLAVPVLLPLVPAVYNRRTPELFGLPAFYWIQLVYIAVGVAVTAAVYRLTRGRRR